MGIEIRLESNLSEVMRKLDGVAMDRMREAADVVRNRILEKLSGNRSGREYKVPGTQRTYIASAPGEPPAQMTGELRQHIGIEIGRENNAPVGKVGTDIPYGRRLERGDSRILPRPWLEPSFEESRDEVIAIFNRPWEGAG